MAANKHPRPSDAAIEKVIRKATTALKDDPASLSSSYRRGLAEALTWVLGRNLRFDNLSKERA